jgi:hypothetical protein
MIAGRGPVLCRTLLKKEEGRRGFATQLAREIRRNNWLRSNAWVTFRTAYSDMEKTVVGTIISESFSK